MMNKINMPEFRLNNKDCAIPNDDGMMFSMFANTPEWLRRYCFEALRPKDIIQKVVIEKQLKNYFLNVKDIGKDGKITLSKEYFEAFCKDIGVTSRKDILNNANKTTYEKGKEALERIRTR